MTSSDAFLYRFLNIRSDAGFARFKTIEELDNLLLDWPNIMALGRYQYCSKNLDVTLSCFCCDAKGNYAWEGEAVSVFNLLEMRCTDEAYLYPEFERLAQGIAEQLGWGWSWDDEEVIL